MITGSRHHRISNIKLHDIHVGAWEEIQRYHFQRHVEYYTTLTLKQRNKVKEDSSQIKTPYKTSFSSHDLIFSLWRVCHLWSCTRFGTGKSNTGILKWIQYMYLLWMLTSIRPRYLEHPEYMDLYINIIIINLS